MMYLKNIVHFLVSIKQFRFLLICLIEILRSVFKNKNQAKKAKDNEFFFLWDVVVLS